MASPKLPSSRYRLAPSILSADFSRLGDEVQRVEAAGADQIHVDVMDGHFVNNISMGPAVVRALRKATRLPLDVHLMITEPLRYLDPFVEAGADHVTFHVESDSDPRQCIDHLRGRGMGVGVAISPDTPASEVLDLLPLVDMILVMTVYPGFGGQRLIESTLEKIPQLRKREKELRKQSSKAVDFPLAIEVDGGIDAHTLPVAARAGANVFVAGNSIFGEPDPGAAVRRFKDQLSGFKC